ncbi:hypothetical protein ebA1427 [Aromatoleum aromaticum EbN1]|uniref:Uncharacterized protein n=1 Tax=Aromatoleum aromaticum (strain DSM 19018 / LMG 30748 / EbN1) TaxID=76114 RepID=Q5P710_AROAE|nr:hypothetical protein ebA1427 [Aromatoleum aromaticum EbN1]
MSGFGHYSSHNKARKARANREGLAILESIATDSDDVSSVLRMDNGSDGQFWNVETS